MKQKADSLRKSTKIDKLIKGQRENIQINKFRNEKGNIMTDTEDISRES